MTGLRTTILTAGVMLVAVACSSSEPVVSSTTPATTATTAAPTLAPTTTSSVPMFGADDALAVADSYFSAYNEGDAEAVKALFVPDATFADNFGSQDRADWEQLLVWNAAQGTALSPGDCRVDQEIPGVSVTLYCPHDNLDALVQAVDGPPVPINLTLVVAPDGIQRWTFLFFSDPDFNTVGRPFTSWMSANHPDVTESVGFGNWTTTEEAEQNGTLTAEYAAEWAAYLQANDCAYDDGC